jgi:MFS family permease
VTATFLVAMVRASASGRAIEPMIWLTVGLAAFPSLLLWDWVASRLGARPAYAAAAVLEALGVLLAGGWPTDAGLLLAAALLGGTLMGLTALGFAVAREFGADGQERRFAVITVGFGLGQAIGPVLGGAASDWSGGYWVPSALAAAALGLAAAIILASARRKPARPGGASIVDGDL